MLAAKTRSGLVESVHDGAVAVSSPEGDLIAWSGELDEPFYLRSAAKPFQAHVAQREGSALRPVEVALASASHDGEAVQVAIIESMLDGVGLSPSDLRCPRDWPNGPEAYRRVLRQGHARPRRIWHNCSGKHAAWLRACVARGWPVAGYLDPGHPLQLQIVELMSELSEYPVTPVGVDGCGAPVFRTTARSMSLLYARLAAGQELAPVFDAMHRYSSLVSGYGHGEASIARSINASAKRGAAGCLGVAIAGRLGVAVKAWDGLNEVANVAAVATLHELGELPLHAAHSLAPVARPAVLGGGRPVGVVESRVDLRWS